MDKLIKIFSQLGVDQTFFWQFAIFFVIFFVLKNIFFEKLLSVLMLREEKTYKLEEKANKNLVLANQLGQEYQSKIDDSYRESQGKLNARKKKIAASQLELLKGEEARINAGVKKKQDEITKEVGEKQKLILSHSNDLAKSLVGKLMDDVAVKRDGRW